jgi:hypothetical protein
MLPKQLGILLKKSSLTPLADAKSGSAGEGYCTVHQEIKAEYGVITAYPAKVGLKPHQAV